MSSSRSTPGPHRAGDAFTAGGEMAARVNALDWAATPVGPIASWPQSLRGTVKTLLGSRYPMILLWGPELIQIRTPINAMIGYTQLLAMGIAGPLTDEQAAQLARIGASGRHLRGLIDDILDLSRIEAGRLTVGISRGSLAESVEAAMALVRPEAAAKGIALTDRCECGAGGGYLGDPPRVQQVLVNLLSNATKFTPAGGRIHVRCGTTERPNVDLAAASAATWTYFAVEDTGIGIAPELLERIFQPFVQGEAGYTRAHSGTGLGLTISRRLARLMGGDLTVESVQGEGSCFTLWLPAATAPASPPAGERRAGAL